MGSMIEDTSAVVISFCFRSCTDGSGITGSSSRGSSGAGHGGNGGLGTHQSRVGAAFGNLYEPKLFGCRGGGNGGYGGGKLKVTVNDTMKVDGVISCNGATGSSGYSGGGSGGSIWIESNLIRGYGKIQVLTLACLSTSNNYDIVLWGPAISSS